MDGIVSDQEIENAKMFDVIYEQEPGYNTSPSHETTVGFLTYSNKFLICWISSSYREKVVADIHPRDNRSIYWRMILQIKNIHLDTYGDARNNIIINSNPSGSQSDAIRIPGISFGGGPNVNSNVNFDFQSTGRLTDDGYELEFIIPFSKNYFRVAIP